MPFHISMFNQQQSAKTGGWSENFWNATSDLSVLIGSDPTPGNPAGSPGLLGKLQSLMNDFKGAQAFINEARVSDIATFRLVETVDFPFSGPHSPTPVNYPDADYPNTALQITLTSTAGIRTRQWLRGIPDAIVSNSGQYNPGGAPQFATQINAFFNFLTNSSNGWSVRGLDKTKQPTPIQGFNYTTGVVSANGHNITPIGSTQQVRIKGLGKGNVGNGVWQVVVTDANTLTIAPWTVPSPIPSVTGKKPKVTWQQYVLQPIAKCKAVRISSHKTGRPTKVLSGRRTTRRS